MACREHSLLTRGATHPVGLLVHPNIKSVKVILPSNLDHIKRIVAFYPIQDIPGSISGFYHMGYAFVSEADGLQHIIHNVPIADGQPTVREDLLSKYYDVSKNTLREIIFDTVVDGIEARREHARVWKETTGYSSEVYINFIEFGKKESFSMCRLNDAIAAGCKAMLANATNAF